MRSLVVLYMCVLNFGCLLSQDIQINLNNVDSIIISSSRGYYHFDRYTSYSNDEIIGFSLVDLINKSVCGTWVKTKRSRNHKLNINKEKTKIKSDDICVSVELLDSLVSSLVTSKKPVDVYEIGRFEEALKLINISMVKKVYKSKGVGWMLRPKYTDKEDRVKLLDDMQSVDTFKLFLSELYDTLTNTYQMITDVHNVITIRIVGDNIDYDFEGKYPNVFKQPFYFWDRNVNAFPCSIYNVMINRYLVSVLPSKFLGLDSINNDSLAKEYIGWYMKRIKDLY